MILTIDTMPDLAEALAPAARAVIMATAHAQLERERMDALDRELIAFWKPVNQYTGKPITEPKDTWTMAETYWTDYHADRQAKIDAMGYKLARDFCPALVAEEDERKAKRLLLDVAAEFVPELAADRVAFHLETYRKAVDLLMRIAVNHPGFRGPKL